MVSPSVAYIETPTGHGSGVLVQGGYVITNAHVVWPYETVGLRFPSGAAFTRAPVAGIDTLIDVAVIGPITTNTPRLKLADGEHLPVGSDVLLIGYPGSVEGPRPQPTVVRGGLSRFRESGGITFLQADASIAGGQSGGALVSAHGDLIGISGQSYTEAQFSLSASAADIAPYVSRLADGRETSGLGDRAIRRASGRMTQRIVAGEWDGMLRGFMIDGIAGATIDLRLTGSADGGVAAYDVFGQEWLRLDKAAGGTEQGAFDVRDSQPFFVLVWASGQGDVVTQSSHSLIPLPDDDGRSLGIGQTLVGNIDFPWDEDIFPVRLTAGDTIEVTARSTLADPFLYVYQRYDEYAYGDNSGGGGFGTDAKVVWRAPSTGTFYVEVGTDSLAPAGYTVTVQRAARTAPLTDVVRPTAPPVPTPVLNQHWEVYEDIAYTQAFYTNQRDREYAPWLIIRCAAVGGLDVYVTWDQAVVETQTSVWADDDSENVIYDSWLPSTSGEASFHPSPHVMLAWLLRASAAGSEVHILSHGSDIGASFEVSGLRAALQSMVGWNCGSV